MVIARRRFLGAATLGVLGAACRGSGTGRGASEAAVEPSTSSTGPTTVRTTASVVAAVEAFLAAPDSNGAALLAVAMADSGDVGWVPYLLDLLRFNGDPMSDGQIMASLQRLTGRPVLDDVAVALVSFGSWLLDESPVPVAGYGAWKRRFYERVEPAATSWFAAVEDRVLAELVWSGTTPAQRAPLRARGRTAVREIPLGTFGDDELVFGIVVDGVAVAYPERFLGHHEVLDDRVGALDVTVSYCPLSRIARAMPTDGRALRASGLVRRSNRVLVDERSGRLVQQRDGMPLDGSAPSVPAPVPVHVTTWSAWSRRHPAGEVLLLDDPGPAGPVPAYRPGGASAAYDAYGRLSYPVRTPPTALPPKATVAGLAGPAGGGQAIAVDGAALARLGPVVIDRPGAAVARILAVAAPEGARCYDASSSAVPSGPVTVTAAGDERAVLAGGEVLVAVPTERMAWFAWFDLHPAGTWWPRR